MFMANGFNEIRNLLSRWSTTWVLLGLTAVAMAAATLIEAQINSEAARSVIYHAWWFNLLLLALALNFIVLTHDRKLWARRRWGTLLLHYGFVVILIGAFITHVWGFEGYMHIREGMTSDRMMTSDREARTLPFSIKLNRFTISRYHGSHSPSSYESDVTIRHNGTELQTKIYMNNIARVGGYRLYQSSFDQDEKGTVLSVNYDPVGTTVTYIGYALLFVGLIVAVSQKNSRLRTLYRQLKKSKTALLIALLFALSTPCVRGATPNAPDVSRDVADHFGHLPVQSPAGRIEPFDSYASEIFRKLHRKDTYAGLNANQVVLGTLIDPMRWSKEPFIYIGSTPLPEELDLHGKYLSYEQMFDPMGRYKLHNLVEKIYAKAPGKRTKQEQAVLKLDEKVNILYGLLEYASLPLFPLRDSVHWKSPLGTGMSAEDSSKCTALFSAFVQNVIDRKDSAAIEAIHSISTYQQEQAQVHIHPAKLSAEVLYNRTAPFRFSFRAYLILGAVLLFLALRRLSRPEQKGLRQAIRIVSIAICCIFAIHTLGLILRGYISGHAPWSNTYETIVYVAWATVLSGLIFIRRSPLALALASLLGGVVLFVANLNWLDPQITPLVPVLKSPWLMIHVSVITASYGFFGICTACGITSLVATIRGRDLVDLRIINEMSMIVGVVLLTFGIFFGAIWANESWGRYWGWDPKETWALITLLLYSLIIHLKFSPRFHNNRLLFDVLSVAGFSTVLMTFFGVNYYLSGLHSYGTSEGLPSGILLGSMVCIVILIFLASRRYYKDKKRSKIS